MAKVMSILDFFSPQHCHVDCPACGQSIDRSKLNKHLDNDCISVSVTASSSQVSIPSEQQNAKAKSNHKKQLPKKGTKQEKKVKSPVKTSKENSINKSVKSYFPSEKSLESNNDPDIVKNYNNYDGTVNNKARLSLSKKFPRKRKSSSGEDNSPKKLTAIDIEKQLPETNGKHESKTPYSDPSMEKPQSSIFTMSLRKQNRTSNEVIGEQDSELTVQTQKEKLKESLIKLNKDNADACINALDFQFDNVSVIENETSTLNVSLHQERINKSSVQVNDGVCPDLLEQQVCPNKPVAQVNDDDDNHVIDRDDADTDLDKAPYYLENFRFIIKAVLDCPDDGQLFNSEDLHLVDVFNNLSEASQKLFIRLFQRKHRWLRKDQINYPNISSNLELQLKQLVDNGFLLSEQSLVNTEEALDLLTAPDVRTLAKSMHVTSKLTKKKDLVEALLKQARQQKSIFTLVSGSVASTILKKTRQLIGQCFKLDSVVHLLFDRIMAIFSLTADLDDDNHGKTRQLFTMLLVSLGKVVFPSYRVERQRQIFRTRECLMKYVIAMQLDTEIATLMEFGNFKKAFELSQKAVNEFKIILEDKKLIRHDKRLPEFLRRYTTGATYVRILTYRVEILQRLKDYSGAVAQLEELLEQRKYCQNYRGRWWDRLALNLEQHLKKPKESFQVIQQAMIDGRVRSNYQLSLFQRARRICSSASNKKLKKILKTLPAIEPKEACKVFVQGRLFPRTIAGRKSLFISSDSYSNYMDSGADMVICSVEELALRHYHSQGYLEGIHGEGSIFTTICALLFWDIIFTPGIPDVFRSCQQMGPLDLRCDDFYKNRKELIDSRLQFLSSSTTEVLEEEVTKCWELHYGEMCCLISWELFRDVEHVNSLIKCLKCDILMGIIERLIKDHRHHRAGMPDLTVWNPINQSCKVVEVKGPNDRLSTKQIMWLDYFMTLGVEAEVCYVTAVGSRKLQRPEV